MSHVGHGQLRAGAQRRDFSGHALARGQCRTGEAGPVHGLGEDGVGLVLLGRDDDVIGLGHGDAQFVNLDRLDVVAVGLHHGHLQTGDAHVEIGHGSRVDEPQAHPLTRFEQA